jgi:hypothetical protein
MAKKFRFGYVDGEAKWGPSGEVNAGRSSPGHAIMIPQQRHHRVRPAMHRPAQSTPDRGQICPGLVGSRTHRCRREARYCRAYHIGKPTKTADVSGIWLRPALPNSIPERITLGARNAHRSVAIAMRQWISSYNDRVARATAKMQSGGLPGHRQVTHSTRKNQLTVAQRPG